MRQIKIDDMGEIADVTCLNKHLSVAGELVHNALACRKTEGSRRDTQVIAKACIPRHDMVVVNRYRTGERNRDLDQAAERVHKDIPCTTGTH